MGFLRRSADREPVLVLATALGVVGLAAGALGPPIRRGMGKDASQYYGAPTTAAQKKAIADSVVRGHTQGVLERSLREERARNSSAVGFWVKKAVGSTPELLRSSDVEGGHVVRKSSVLLKN